MKQFKGYADAFIGSIPNFSHGGVIILLEVCLPTRLGASWSKIHIYFIFIATSSSLQ